MAKAKSTNNEQMRRLNQRLQALNRKLSRLAPAGALEYEGTTDGTMLTWQNTLWAVSNAADCLDELAEDSIIDELLQAEKEAAAMSASIPPAKIRDLVVTE